MRSNVSFRYPAEFVPFSEEDQILAVQGADWFIALLRRVPGLQIENELCQEDWGVVVFASRNGKQFWIGLSLWPDGKDTWLAHIHHGSFAWLQRLSRSGNAELKHLISDFHDVLASDPAVAAITWYSESEIRKPSPQGFATPNEP